MNTNLKNLSWDRIVKLPAFSEILFTHIPGSKGAGQEIFDSGLLLRTALPVGDQYQGIQAKFSHDLAAGATGGTTIVRRHGDDLEFFLSFGNGLENGNPFGAHTGGIGGVLHIAAGKD